MQLALDLGVAPSRVDTVANFEAVEKFGVKGDGSMVGSSAAVLAELAGLIAAGELEIPIFATYPLDQVQDAYRGWPKATSSARSSSSPSSRPAARPRTSSRPRGAGR